MYYRISRATCTMSIKEFWRSSAVVASPVIRESEMVRMENDLKAKLLEIQH